MENHGLDRPSDFGGVAVRITHAPGGPRLEGILVLYKP
jgi:hypothetical protein